MTTAERCKHKRFTRFGKGLVHEDAGFHGCTHLTQSVAVLPPPPEYGPLLHTPPLRQHEGHAMIFCLSMLEQKKLA